MMTTGPGRGRAALRLLLLAALAAAPAAPVLAQDDEETDIEEFPAEDPYTEGEEAKLEELGYLSYGPFVWIDGELTDHVKETMGAVPVLWVETAHFKIGSALGTYDFTSDKEERALIEGELKRFKKRIGRARLPKKELDPWLRLHLYAQRLEQLYADFCETFELSAADFPEEAPYLGQRGKFLVLLCQTRSSLGRVLKRYVNVDQDHSYRYRFHQQGFFFGVSAEALESGGWNLDAAIYCAVASAVVQNLLDGYEDNAFGTPAWWRYGLAHGFSRRIDPRWTPAIGMGEGRYRNEEDSLWEERVSNLVANDFFASTLEMFGWQEYGDLDVRDHMVVWSKVDYLLQLEGGDRKRFLDALCQRKPEGSPEEAAAKLVQRQVDALDACFGLSPEGLDEDWAKYVKKRYR